MKSISLYLWVSSSVSGKGGSVGYGIGVPFLLIHLLEGVCDVERADFFVVLEFKKLVAAVARHVDKYIGAVVC